LFASTAAAAQPPPGLEADSSQLAGSAAERCHYGRPFGHPRLPVTLPARRVTPPAPLRRAAPRSARPPLSGRPPRLTRSRALAQPQSGHIERATLALSTERVDPSQQRASLEAGAVSELQGIARFRFHEGKLEEFKRLSAQAMAIVRTRDMGTLQYEICFNDDQSECIVLERYKDSEALIEHAAHLGDLTDAILATGYIAGELLGEPSSELRANMAGSEVRLFTPYQSM
jgi:quinol monooxygenase YgiN